MPDTPEERHDRPLKWEPADPSGEAVKQLEVVLGVAVNGNMISAQDAERMLRIIKTNPCARLGRMGQRLAILESVAKDLRNLDFRLTFAINQTQESMDSLKEICRMQWMEEDSDEEG